MAQSIIGFGETYLHTGVIDTEWTFTPADAPQFSKSLQHNFGPSNIWSHPYLQGMWMESDDSAVNLWVAEFVDQAGAHTGNLNGVSAQKCTSVTFNMFTRNCFATGVFTTYFFG
jgi:hypothetical protein